MCGIAGMVRTCPADAEHDRTDLATRHYILDIRGVRGSWLSERTRIYCQGFPKAIVLAQPSATWQTQSALQLV